MPYAYFIINFTRNPLQTLCSNRKKKVIAKIRGKFEDFTLNPNILDNFTYNILEDPPF